MNSAKQAKGRPVNEEKQAIQKAKLLASAEHLLAEKSYSNITIRELAQHSGINSAMISYYFTNKEGLFIALLDDISIKQFAVLQNVLHAEDPIRSFIETILSMLNQNHGLARLIHNEFLMADSKLSEVFIERFPKKMAAFVPILIKNNTSIEDERKAKYAAFSLITMLITPFIHKPIRQKAWQISDEELQSPIWVEHIHQQFLFGCNNQANSITDILLSKDKKSLNAGEVLPKENK